MTAVRPSATVSTPAVWVRLDRVRVAFAPGQVKTYVASAASTWRTLSDGTSDSPRDRVLA